MFTNNLHVEYTKLARYRNLDDFMQIIFGHIYSYQHCHIVKLLQSDLLASLLRVCVHPWSCGTILATWFAHIPRTPSPMLFVIRYP